MLNASSTPVLKRTFAIKVIGVGGAGCNALGHIAAQSLDGVSYAVMNTDAPVLARSPVKTRLMLGAKTMRGLGAGGDPERGQAAAEEDAEQIRAFCGGADIIFVVAGMGGGTGTGAAPVVARIAQEAGALVLGLVFMPFDCEGPRRKAVAQAGLQDLQAIADGVICLPNQDLFKFIDEKTTLVDAFGISNQFVAQGVQSIWRLLLRPGLINVDFADLCTLTRGKHSAGVLATIEARGESRCREALDKLLAHPLIENGQALAEATGLLVAITGGLGLTMAEVNRITEQIQRCAENAHIFMGAAVEKELEDRICVTIVASRQNSRLSRPLDNTPVSRNGEARSNSRFDPEEHLLESEQAPRPAARFIAPPPELTPQNTERIMAQNGKGGRHRKKAPGMRQGQLPLEIISRGRFEKSEPTIHRGEDLDVPTYIRRGIALN